MGWKLCVYLCICGQLFAEAAQAWSHSDRYFIDHREEIKEHRTMFICSSVFIKIIMHELQGHELYANVITCV